jgi:hypothetical protein
MENKPASEIHPGARELIWDIWEHRFLTPDQVSRLYGIPLESARLVLDRVAQAGYLAALPRPTVTADEPNLVYALDQRGADEVALRLGNDRETVRWRKYHNQVGRQYMDHRLAVNDVRIALTAGVRGLGGEMREWIYEPPIKEWSVYDPDQFAPPLRLRPDAYALFTPDNVFFRSVHAFVEVDMGTESNDRFASKIKRYLAYRESRLFRVRFGGRAFRVLFVALSSVRVRTLRRVAERLGAERTFWFARLSDLVTAPISDPVWQLAGGDGSGVSLLQPPVRAL